jgi:Na+/H+ antiporter NhaC
MTVIALVLSFTKIGFKKEVSSAADKKELEESEHGEGEAHEQCVFEQKAPPRVFNLILPLALLIALILFFAWYTGSNSGGTFFNALQNADYERSIFIASALTLFLTAVYYTFQRMPLKEIEMHFLKGGAGMIPPIAILIFSWGLSSLVKDLGFIDLISGIASTGIPLFLIPVTIFLLCCLSSYFIGSAWGTWALVMPLAVSLAVKADMSLPLTIGAVLSGGALGDNASPLGETAVLTASVTELPLMEHVKSQLPISLTGVAISTLFFLFVPLLPP